MPPPLLLLMLLQPGAESESLLPLVSFACGRDWEIGCSPAAARDVGADGADGDDGESWASMMAVFRAASS
jgi:hypothetical protein